MEEYYYSDLLGAMSFAVNWLWQYHDSYWVVLRGPNGKVILGNREVERMYHAEVRASGGSITMMSVQPASYTIVAGRLAVQSPVILSEHRID